MSTISKTSFYHERLYRYTLTSTTEEDEKKTERKKLKEMAESPLSEEIFQLGLKNFAKTAAGEHYSFLTLELPSYGIFSILGIEKYIHLQQVDLSNNNLVTLKPLSYLIYLTHINASRNRLTKMFDFQAPKNLVELILNENEITEMSDMSTNRFLRKLCLNNNLITSIDGLSTNKYLLELQLNNNLIEAIDNLDDLNLVELHLFGNKISQLKTGLERLPKLRVLNLSRNKIQKIRGLKQLQSLRTLYLSDNLISKIKDLSHIEQLTLLFDLDLCFNPIQKRRYYRLQVLYRFPHLRSLDGVTVTQEDSIKAENLYGLELEERKRIFLQILPEEEFIDRRIHRSEFIDPETDSDTEDIEFQDKYDKKGNLLSKANSKGSLNMSKTNLSKGGSTSKSKFRDDPKSPTSGTADDFLGNRLAGQ